jgi:hypothetical protein
MPQPGAVSGSGMGLTSPAFGLKGRFSPLPSLESEPPLGGSHSM